MRKVEGIKRRVKISNERWYLRIGSKDIWDVMTITKRERNILNGIRKMLIGHGITSEHIELTNKVKAEPMICPNCKTPYWRTKRKNKKNGEKK